MKKDLSSGQDAAASGAELFDGSAQGKQERTFGLKAFDVGLYPFLTNFGVFATSVYFTYLTNRGSQYGKAGSMARRFGELLELRGDAAEQFFLRAGLSAEGAQNARMVFWSFFDGSLLSPVIKGFEDNREFIASSIDKAAGTQPDDPSVYDAEPKQTWGSVLGGRALTAGIVVTTAAQLNKAGPSGISWNQKCFYDPGLKFGQKVRQTFPKFSARFSEGTFRELSKVTLFEGFYTSVCTAGQYAFSRSLARIGDHRDNVLMPAITGKSSDDDMKLSNLMVAHAANELNSKATSLPPETRIKSDDSHAEPLQTRSAERSA